jgi:hypothetical protein
LIIVRVRLIGGFLEWRRGEEILLVNCVRFIFLRKGEEDGREYKTIFASPNLRDLEGR